MYVTPRILVRRPLSDGDSLCLSNGTMHVCLWCMHEHLSALASTSIDIQVTTCGPFGALYDT